MTSVVVITTATVRVPGSLRPPAVYRHDQFPRLVDDVSVGLGLYVVYAQDITLPHPRGWSPENLLAVSVDDEGWGAAYYRHENSPWIARNPHPATDAPALMFDSEAGTDFPTDAVFPLDQIRAAVQEYLRTGQRPRSVQWHMSDRAMIY
jgi:hypothetical protein